MLFLVKVLNNFGMQFNVFTEFYDTVGSSEV